MSVWDSYPSTYRSEEVRTVLSAVKAGECASIVGLSGAGKSNLMGFLAHRIETGPAPILVDCNFLPSSNLPSLLTAMTAALGGAAPDEPFLAALIPMVEKRLEKHPAGLCFLLDRFDPFNLPSDENSTVSANLRALRDRFKYSLTYVTATRTPLDPASELAELFSAHTLWLGSLSHDDALWSIGQFAARRGSLWDDQLLEGIYALSSGYPSMLRAVCEALAAGVPLEPEAMRSAPAVRRRVQEFWFDVPSPEALRLSGLDSHPLLIDAHPPGEVPDLTALEQRLLDYFNAHPGVVCAKDELIQAVWPEEKLSAGLRDDSLAQLVHRLRDKLESGGMKRIQTIPGRGYRYRV
ncbi:MAG: winged helix-turn-helix domain-containing protein [Anaerolineaceae bacterium]